MKVGIVTTWFERGAAYVSKQFKEVWEEENEVFIYVRGGESLAKSDPNWNQGDITYGKRFDYSILDIIDLGHFQSWIEEKELDVVFFNEQHIWDPILLCNKLGVKTGSYIDYYTKDTVPFFGMFDFLICNTKRHYGVFEWHPHVYYVPWGTDTEIYNDSQRKVSKPNEVTFFHSAGMNPYRKGTDLVIRAFEKISNESANLVVHTQSEIEGFFPNLSKSIKNLVETKRLTIIHKTVSSPGLYYLGDVYVYPSRLEGIGLTIAEASACGMPVITSNVAPMNEFVVDGVNGKLVNVSSDAPRKDGYFWNESVLDLQSLVQQMRYYVDNLSGLNELKDKSYSYAQENLSWKTNSKKLSSVLTEVGEQKRENKGQVLDEIENYENTRGWWYYFANTKPYQNLKRIVFNTIRRIKG